MSQREVNGRAVWATTPAERQRLIAAWPILLDHVSINFHEDLAENLARWFLHRGVHVDAGIWTGTN